MQSASNGQPAWLYWIAAGIGGAAGALGGAFGGAYLDGLMIGAVVGGVVAWLFSQAPRSPMAAAVAVEAFMPAGFLGGLAGALSEDASLFGGFLACGVGTLLGVVVPAGFISIASRTED